MPVVFDAVVGHVGSDAPREQRDEQQAPAAQAAVDPEELERTLARKRRRAERLAAD